MKKAGLALLFGVSVMVGAAPAEAQDDALAKAIAGYGAAAGMIEASVPFCGGPAEEVDYFITQAKELAEKAGAGPVEWSAIEVEMEKSKNAAVLKDYHCTEDGGRELATRLMVELKALKSALQ